MGLPKSYLLDGDEAIIGLETDTTLAPRKTYINEGGDHILPPSAGLSPRDWIRVFTPTSDGTISTHDDDEEGFNFGDSGVYGTQTNEQVLFVPDSANLTWWVFSFSVTHPSFGA